MTLDELVLLFRVDAAKGLSDLNRVKTDISATKETVNKVSAGFKGFASALSLAAVAMGAYRLAQRQINFGNIATQTGHSIQSVVALSRSFEKMGLSAESAQAAIRQVADEVGNYKYKGTPSSTLNAAGQLGVGFLDANGNFREAQDLYLDLAKRQLEQSGGDKKRAFETMVYLRGLNRELSQWALNTTRAEWLAEKQRGAIDKEREERLKEAIGKYKGLQEQIENLSVTVLNSFVPTANKAFDSFKPVIDLMVSSPAAIENSMKAFINLRLLAINPLLGSLSAIVMWFDEILEFIQKIGRFGSTENYGADVKENFKALEESGTGKLTLSNIGKTAVDALKGMFGDDGYSLNDTMHELSGWKIPSKSNLLSNRERKAADLIGRLEGGNDKAGGGYNAVNYGERYDYKGGVEDLSNMTVDEVLRRQKNRDFNAVGKYQFIRSTLPGVVAEAQKLYGLQGSAKFDASTQDLLFKTFVQQDPILRKYFNGEIGYSEEVQNAISKKWASVPYSRTGRSYYDNTGKNQHLITSAQLARLLGEDFAPAQIPNLATRGKAGTNININGAITINTRATDAEGIKKDLTKDVYKYSKAKAYNSGAAA